MPIGIGVQGGTTRDVALTGIQRLTKDEALDSLQNIRTNLSQPGRDGGVLTLHNRTKDGSEMTLERKSGTGLWFQDERLDDTVVALRTLLARAGKAGAVQELEDYLTSQDGKQNRIESRKMLEILNTHLPPCSSTKEVLTQARMGVVGELGSGSFGTASLLLTEDGDIGVYKEFKTPQPLSLERGPRPNEAMGSYLTSRKHPNYLRDTVNVAQPTFYMISVETNGNREYRTITPHAMRRLVKEAMKTGSEVLCHGLIMPKAGGKEVGKLISEGKLAPSEKRQCIRGMLQSIKGLNERGFVHRDIKPDNSYFDRKTGTTTLIDTGSLFKTSKNQEKNPGTDYIEVEPQNRFTGTEYYMHPRALLKERHGTETDLYALGVSSVQVDHPLAFEQLLQPIKNQNFKPEGITRDWLRGKLQEEIAVLKEGPRKAERYELHDQVILDLEALLQDIDDDSTLSSFGLHCLDRARLPPEDWQNRETSQGIYSQLLEHPVLKVE